MNSIIIDLNRKRAGISYINLNNFCEEQDKKNGNKDNKKSDGKLKMKSYCRKLPVLIKTNGLINTLCFIKGKGNTKESDSPNEYKKIYKWLNEWFEEIGLLNDHEDLIQRVMNLENNEYYIYTKEAIEISNWYKRNAEAMIEDNGQMENVEQI